MPRSRRSRQEGRYFVGDHACPTVGAAISYAQTLATRVPRKEERSFYVRDTLGEGLYRVDVDQDGVITTHQTEGRAA